MRELARRAVAAGMADIRRELGADVAAELRILAVLEEGDPGTARFGEETGGDLDEERVWVVDPVDGTQNLLRGSDFVAVTCALLESGVPVAAATGCPFTGEIFSAARGEGAFGPNGERLRVTDSGPIAVDPEESNAEYLARWQEVCSVVGAPELRAATALELAYCAAGHFAGVVIVGRPEIQDCAAGALLVEEAGGRISPWPQDLVVAGAPCTFERLTTALAVSMRPNGAAG